MSVKTKPNHDSRKMLHWPSHCSPLWSFFSHKCSLFSYMKETWTCVFLLNTEQAANNWKDCKLIPAISIAIQPSSSLLLLLLIFSDSAPFSFWRWGGEFQGRASHSKRVRFPSSLPTPHVMDGPVSPFGQFYSISNLVCKITIKIPIYYVYLRTQQELDKKSL